MKALLLTLFGLLFHIQAIAAQLPAPATDADFRAYSDAKVKLGRLLFYDRLLSGTYRVSCATCHNPDRASSNGFRTDRKADVEGDDLAINGLSIYDALKPSSEHAPTLFNLGAKEFTRMFSDGRVEAVGVGKFRSPAEALPKGLDDVLAAQALFPAVTGDELVGQVDSDISAVAHLGNAAIWDALAKRVAGVTEYWPHLKEAYPELDRADDVTIVEIVNAIGAFVGTEWRLTSSPFDAYLTGDENALSADQRDGMAIFYGKGTCSSCHSGTFQTDHQFHTVGLPLWRFDADLSKDEFSKVREGRGIASDEPNKAYAYRTPSLRNVTVTAPYGHAGSYEALEDVVRAHLAPRRALTAFLTSHNPSGGPLPKVVQRDATGLASEIKFKLISLTDPEIKSLIVFLDALTDKNSLQGRLGRPNEVPSSLALD